MIRPTGLRPRLGRLALAAAALLFLAAPQLPAPGQLADPAAQRELEESRALLCGIYDVSPEACAAPMDIVIAVPGAAPPPGWGGLPAYAAGAADPAAGRIVIFPERCGRYPFGSPAQTLRHELSHVLLRRALGFPAPRWFDEGLAMRVSGEWGASDEMFSALALHAVARGRWDLAKVDRDFAGGEGQVRRSYALAKAFVRDLFPSNADLKGFMMEARAQRSVDRAFYARFGRSPDDLFRAWAKNLPWWGEWIVWLSQPAVLWGVVTVLFVTAFLSGLRRRRRKYEQLPD
jgi:hypothetical protein